VRGVGGTGFGHEQSATVDVTNVGIMLICAIHRALPEGLRRPIPAVERFRFWTPASPLGAASRLLDSPRVGSKDRFRAPQLACVDPSRSFAGPLPTPAILHCCVTIPLKPISDTGLLPRNQLQPIHLLKSKASSKPGAI
jgi:hypothetical protein